MTRSPSLFAALALVACGEAPMATFATASEQAIIGGVASQPGDYPAVGVLLVDGSDPYFGEFASMACTGTLIAPDAVLLAAHCLDTAVYYGAAVNFNFSFSEDVQSYGTSTMALPANTYEVIDSVMHESFDIQAFDYNVNGPGLYYDVAIAFLGTEVTNRTPAMVMSPADSYALAVNTPVEIVGYGMRSANYNPYNPDPDNSALKYHADTFINEVGTTEMQVGDANPVPQKCHGDSGGPTFLNYDDDLEPSQRLVGITSHAYDESDCYRGGVDTRVDAYRDWIENELMDACSTGVRLSCDNDGALALPIRVTPPPPPPGATGTPTTPSSKYYKDDCSQTRPEPFAALLLLVPLLRRRRR